MFDKLISKIAGGNTLYYPGCLTKFVLPEAVERYKKILNSIGVDFIVLSDAELCCGMPVLNAGYRKDYEQLREKNKKIFKEHGVSRIITNCPSCNQMFSDYGIESEHVIETIHRNKSKLKKTKSGEEITYHDPCHLGRGCGIFDEPREILAQIGYIVKELPLNREHSLCCGGGAGLKTNYPELSNNIAKCVLESCETNTLITPCPLCYRNFKDNSESVSVLEYSEVLL